MMRTTITRRGKKRREKVRARKGAIKICVEKRERERGNNVLPQGNIEML
jgi:hypothetical protein